MYFVRKEQIIDSKMGNKKGGNLDSNRGFRGSLPQVALNLLAAVGLFVVYFCMAASNRVFGILLIALQSRFPAASVKALNSLSGVVSAVPYLIGVFKGYNRLIGLLGVS